MQTVNRTLRAAHAMGDLTGRKTHEVAQDRYLALVTRKGSERPLDGRRVIWIRGAAVVGIRHVFHRRHAMRAQVIDAMFRAKRSSQAKNGTPRSSYL
jgi:hypothetical protein